MTAYIADTTVIRDRQDADAWLARLEGVSAALRQQQANARRGLSSGWLQPRPVLESALGVLRTEAALTSTTTRC
jgi:uncharacterized protein (DUF885 family)